MQIAVNETAIKVVRQLGGWAAGVWAEILIQADL